MMLLATRSNKFKYGTVALCLSLLLAWKRRQDKLKHARRSKAEQQNADASPEEIARKKRRKAKAGAMGSLWKLVMPRKYFAPGKDGEGSFQILSMLLLCIGRIWIMNKTSNYVGRLDQIMMTRNQSSFWKYWKLSLAMAVVASIHRQTYKYVENSLGIVWQRKLTTIVHDLYFRNMNYYVCTHGATSSTSLDVDPAERITSDVKEVSSQMSLLFCEGLYTATAGGFFAFKLGRLYGLRYAIAPYLYLWVSFAVTQKLAPVKWGKVLGSIKGLFSKYRTSLERVSTHHEAIHALHGAEYEKRLVSNNFANFTGAVKKFNSIVIRSGFCDQLAFYWWLRQFVSMFVIGPHIFKPRRSRNLTNVEDLAALRGAIGHQFVLFVQSMIAAGVSAKMLRQAQQLGGSAGRLYELIYTMKELEETRKGKEERALCEGDHISFENVQVVTPSGSVLVENLSFSVLRGQSLLLTGHNGAGKSSVFRCLGGLWKVTNGKIIKPGSADSGLHQDVFYLPQKPYNVLGNLYDQLTYPQVTTNPKKVEWSSLEWILSQVDLSHLLNRDGALDQEANWETDLSLGEQQRLAIARLIYHRPKYAILDECTSAVSTDMERRMYQLCQKLGITYITISHRPVLRAYHNQILTIGIGERGYTCEPIVDHSEVLPPFPGVEEMDLTAVASIFTEGVERPRSMSHEKERRDNRTSSLNLTPIRKYESADSNGGALEQLRRLVWLSLPRRSYAKIAVYALTVLSQSRLLVESSLNSASMMSCIFSPKSIRLKKRDFVRLCVKGTLISLTIAGIEQIGLFIKRDLCLDITRKLGIKLTDRYFSRGAFYNLAQVDASCTDAHQRLTVDIRDFATGVTDLLPLFKPVIEIAHFTAHTHALVGSTATSLFAGYLIGGFLLIKGLMPNFSAIVAKETMLEGKYKFVHNRLKTHAESIAFFGGEKIEKRIIEQRFGQLMKVMWLRLKRNWAFGLLQQAIVREAPMLVQYQLRNEYGKTWGSDEELRKDSGQSLNRAQLFLFSSTTIVFEALGEILAAGEKVANLKGLMIRILELDQSLTACHLLTAPQMTNSLTMIPEAESFKLDDVAIVTPKGECLAKGIDIKISPMMGLMVTGPNSSGKTSFFRTLGGLWPLRKGSITRPSQNDVCLVPQRIYMVSGTLADQISYPIHIPVEERKRSGIESEFRKLLEIVGVSYLADREGGWDAEMQWEDVLSLGEQQRIGMARLFFQAPKFGILDECTSAVSIDVEEKLYREALKLGITCITISQRLALQEFHANELILGEANEAGWSLKAIRDSK